MRVMEKLEQLAEAADWRGVAAQELTARAVAAALRTSMPGIASFVYCTLGIAYDSLGVFNKAIEYHTQDLAIAKRRSATGVLDGLAEVPQRIIRSAEDAVDKRSNARHRSLHGGCHRPGRALLRCNAPPVGSTIKLL